MIQRTSAQHTFALIGISLASFLGCVDFTIVNTALPSIQQGLHASMNQLQWIINIFLLALCALMVIAGRLEDLYGRRKLLYIGMVGFGLASLGAGLSTGIGMLLICRLLQGAATAVLYTATAAIIANTFPEHMRGKAIGILSGVNGIGLAIGPVLGGVILGALSWRWIFLINVPILIISFMICLPSVKESRNVQQRPQLDGWGVLYLAVGLSGVILALVEGSQWGWCSPVTIICFAIGILSLIALYVVEGRSPSPIIDFHLFASRAFVSSSIATFSLGFFYCLAFFLMPLYLHNILGYSGYSLGLMLLPTTAVMALLSPVVGRLTDRYGPKPLLLLGAAFFIVSAVLQAHLAATSSVIYIVLSFAAMGVGWAAILGPSTVAALSSVADDVSGVAMGSSWTLHNMGGVLGLALGSLLYHHSGELSLLKAVVKQPTDWVAQAVGNPAQAVGLIQQHTGWSLHQSHVVFERFFIHGYHAAMTLLIVSSALSLVMVWWLCPARKKASV